MIPAHAAVQARDLHASGWTVSAIARHLDHDRKTVRIYLTGARDPGQPRADSNDLFGPFDAYATCRLRQDRHLSATALHRELTYLDYTGSYSALTRSLRQRDLLPTCPDCRRDQLPEITKRASPLIHLHCQQRLPIRVAPVFGQAIASYLDQVAAANHLTIATLLAHLPAWFRRRYRVHDDLAAGTPAGPRDTQALAQITGSDPTALLRALPALAGWIRNRSHPFQMTIACRRCTPQTTSTIPVHLPALQRLCRRHRTWLGQHQQIDTTGCPDIARADAQVARLARHHSATQILHAETLSRETIKRWLTDDRHPALTRRWAARLQSVRASQPLKTGSELDEHSDLIAAATYSETITLAAALLSSTNWTTHVDDRERDDLSALLLGPPRMANGPPNRTLGSPPVANDHLIVCHDI